MPRSQRFGWVRLRRERPVTTANALRQLVAAARYRARPAAPTAPMLLLAGAADALVAAQCSHDLARQWRLASAQHPRAGHDLTLDAGAWVVDEIERWLRSPHGPGPGPGHAN